MRPVSKFSWPQLAGGVALYSTIQLLLLGLPQISGSSEAREAQVIDTILRDGEWVLPLRNGLIPSKPPLFHWVGASISALLGGVSELSVRLPSHLAALGILILVALCSHRIAERIRTIEGETSSGRVAFVAPALLSLTYGFHQLASQAMVDMTYSFFVWGALSAVILSDEGKTRANNRLPEMNRFFFWMASAIAVIARGPVGLALPLLLSIVAGAYLFGPIRALREAFRPSHSWLTMLLPVAWYYAAWRVGGEPFLHRQLLFENIQRIAGSEHMNNEVWWFYLPSLLRTTLPWGALSLIGAFHYLHYSKHLSFLGGFKRWAIVPSVALLAGVALFSLAAGKRHSYMLPLEPLIAIQAAVLLSIYLARLSERIRARLKSYYIRFENTLVAFLILLVLGLAGAYQSDWGYHPVEDLVKFGCQTLALRISFIVLASLVAVTLLKGEESLSHFRAWLLALVALTTLVSIGNVVKGVLRGFPTLTEQILLVAGPRREIVVIKEPFDEYFDPIFFYARRHISIIDSTGPFTPCNEAVIYVARRSLLSEGARKILGDVQGLATIQEVRLALEGRAGREIEVFQCRGRRGANSNSTSGPLRDASAKLREETRKLIQGDI